MLVGNTFRHLSTTREIKGGRKAFLFTSPADSPVVIALGAGDGGVAPSPGGQPERCAGRAAGRGCLPPTRSPGSPLREGLWQASSWGGPKSGQLRLFVPWPPGYSRLWVIGSGVSTGTQLEGKSADAAVWPVDSFWDL